MPWFKVYKCSNANDMFNMCVYLLPSAVEKHVTPKKVFFLKKTPNLIKETWFDEECKRTSKQSVQYIQRNNKSSSGTVFSPLVLLKTAGALSVMLGGQLSKL